MNLRDLFVEKPVKTEEVKNELKVEGTFACMDCGYYCDYAVQIDGKMSWSCPKCGYVSSMKAMF